jgi:hypothetical protein
MNSVNTTQIEPTKERYSVSHGRKNPKIKLGAKAFFSKLQAIKELREKINEQIKKMAEPRLVIPNDNK